MIDPGDLLHYVIRPTLAGLAAAEPRLHSPAAEQLLIGTYLVEGLYQGRTRLHQVGGGPALGIWQMEPATFRDLVDWLTRRDPSSPLAVAVEDVSMDWSEQRICGDLYLACAFARLKYWRIRHPLPPANDLAGMAEYWGKYYNTHNNRDWKARFVARGVEHRDVFVACLTTLS